MHTGLQSPVHCEGSRVHGTPCGGVFNRPDKDTSWLPTRIPNQHCRLRETKYSKMLCQDSGVWLNFQHEKHTPPHLLFPDPIIKQTQTIYQNNICAFADNKGKESTITVRHLRSCVVTFVTSPFLCSPCQTSPSGNVPVMKPYKVNELFSREPPEEKFLKVCF